MSAAAPLAADLPVPTRDLVQGLDDIARFGLAIMPEVIGLGSVTVTPALSQARISSPLK